MDRPIPTGPAAPDLRIVEARVYRGGNIWSYDPSIHLVVDLGVLEEYPSDTLPGFYEHLTELLPGLYEHACSVGKPGGFLQRMREGTWMGHVVEHVALELQNLAGAEQPRGKTRGTGERGSTTSSTPTPRKTSASPPASSPCASSTTSSGTSRSSTSSPSWRNS